MTLIHDKKHIAHSVFIWATLSITLLIFSYKALVPHPSVKEGPDFVKFGSIPVLKSGRIKPIDTLARNQLLAINGIGEVKLPEAESYPPGAVESRGKWTLDRRAWLAEALFTGRQSARHPVILVENEQVKALFGEQEADTKRFTPAEVLAQSREISRLAEVARGKADDHLTTFDKQVSQLDQKIQQFLATSATIQPPGDTQYTLVMEKLPGILASVTQAASGISDISAIGSGEALTPSQRAEFNAAGKLISSMQQINNANDAISIRPLPPLDPNAPITDWRKFGDAALSLDRVDTEDKALIAWAKISDGYRAIKSDNGKSFNAAVNDYLAYLSDQKFQGIGKAKTEFWFNGFDPFVSTLDFYVVAGLLVLLGWIVWTKPLTDAAFKLMVVLFIVHTLGIILRIYLSGRPPVTNLYSSAVFIGWGAIGVSLLLERWTLKNGIGTFVAAAIGVATLIIAHQLSFDGDTMEVKQAVLDSNFWLATHVIIITLGYSATFLAGFLALVWAVGSFIKRGLDKQTSKALYGTTYGVICFAMLFSFVGTVLGGIWADQSWGRFWGWDPKENGALIIVLWNAIILHSRWGGISRERGFMALCILGIAITAWSWFGTNLLGVGLHSYGFREGAIEALGWTCLGILVIAILTVLTIPLNKKSPPVVQPSKLPSEA